MCIIAIKEKGVDFPSFESISNCSINNPDGFSMMWNEGGFVKVFKTLDMVKFLKYYKRFVQKHDKDEVAIVIHCRIKTHGTIRLSNCHCWTAENDIIGFAHNGVLGIANRDDLTDSETFFRDIFVPIFRIRHRFEDAEPAINAVIGGSRFAFLTKDGVVHRFGKYFASDGVLFSNSTYLESSWKAHLFKSTPKYKPSLLDQYTISSNNREGGKPSFIYSAYDADFEL